MTESTTQPADPEVNEEPDERATNVLRYIGIHALTVHTVNGSVRVQPDEAVAPGHLAHAALQRRNDAIVVTAAELAAEQAEKAAAEVADQRAAERAAVKAVAAEKKAADKAAQGEA